MPTPALVTDIRNALAESRRAYRERYLSIRDAAEMCGASQEWFKRHILPGLDFAKKGRKVFLRESDVRRKMESFFTVGTDREVLRFFGDKGDGA